MKGYEFKLRARVWIWDGPSPWYFITVPPKEAGYIRKEFLDQHRGWSSLPVEVTIGKSSWATSIFWEKRNTSGTYLLPIKKKIRDLENLRNGTITNVQITLKP